MLFNNENEHIIYKWPYTYKVYNYLSRNMVSITRYKNGIVINSTVVNFPYTVPIDDIDVLIYYLIDEYCWYGKMYDEINMELYNDTMD